MRHLLLIALWMLPVPAWSADDDARARIRALPPLVQDEVLWLARCLYSESDRPDEQRLVAWVVRNRVETAYHGDSYRAVVLRSRQFSAFNEPTPRRAFLLSLDLDSQAPGWAETLGVAYDAYHADAAERPFPPTTRHFYSPVSMEPAFSVPPWAEGHEPLPLPDVDGDRFRFYADVDTAAPGEPSPASTGTSVQVATPTRLEPQRRLKRRLSGRVQVRGAVRPSVKPPAGSGG